MEKRSWPSERGVEDAVYKLVTVTPLDEEEMLNLLKRVAARVAAIPKVKIR
jgi:hypothetical protein